MADPRIPLPSAFDIQPLELVAIVGGGGKSSLMFALAKALPGKVVMTTTTRIFAAQIKLASATVYSDDLSELSSHLAQHQACLVVGHIAGDKALGVDPALPAELLGRPDVDYVLVEADGSRMRPIKAPADHEPVLPDGTTLLVPVVGIDALEAPIAEVAHRPDMVRILLAGAGLSAGDEFLTADAIATLITHPNGGMKNRPEQARVIPCLNKVETEEQLVAARRIAHACLRRPHIDRVVVGAVRTARPVREVHQRVTAIVLAAGQSQRMGATKQLLPWGETTVLGQTLDNLKRSAVNELLVVSGYEAEAVERIAKSVGVDSVYNPQYATGEMLSSLKKAVRQLSDNVAAILVVLADQPMVGPETIDQLLEAYWQGWGELIAPEHEGRRGNPVLIGRRYLDELLALPAGSAPRLLLQRYPDDLHLVQVKSNAVLRDLDHYDDYLQWRPKGEGNP